MRRIGDNRNGLLWLMRIQRRLSRSCAYRLRGDNQRRARRVRRHMLLRHVRRDISVRIVLLMRLLPPRILLHVLGIEGRRRCMMVGIRIDGRLRRRTIHVVVVLLLATRLFVVWNRVARAHVVIIIHGDGGTREAGATGSCWQRWRLLQGGRSRGGEDGERRVGRGQHGWRVRRAMGGRPVVVVVSWW